jgi:hypothetical protein
MLKAISTLLKLFLSFIVGLSIGLGAIYTHYANSHKPYTWSVKPIIANCYSNDLSEEKIKSAFGFWKDQGDEYEFIVMNAPEGICNHDMLHGFILIKKANNIPGAALAKTKVEIKFMKIRSAVIYLEPGTYNIQWLLEHEVGHAFGYKHVEAPGHIMHPYIELQGGKYWKL